MFYNSVLMIASGPRFSYRLKMTLKEYYEKHPNAKGATGQLACLLRGHCCEMGSGRILFFRILHTLKLTDFNTENTKVATNRPVPRLRNQVQSALTPTRIRDWSLITGRLGGGGYKMGGGGACEVLPLRKGGGGWWKKF